MQDRPDKVALLAAVARFLDGTVRPAIEDPGLAFRVRIAANLAKIVATECTLEDAHDAVELAGLAALMPDVGLPELTDGSTRRAAIAELNGELARRIRTRELEDSPELAAHVRRSLEQRLSVINPRFDLSMEIE